MIGHHGSIRIHHWAHRPGADCDPWSEGESDWHLDWKHHARLLGFDVEQTMERDGSKHRADIVCPSGLVIELQHDYLDTNQIEERERFYGNMIWVYDGAEWWESGRLHFGRQLDQTTHGLWFKNGGPSLAMHRRPVYVHIGMQEDIPFSVLNIKVNMVRTFKGTQRMIGKAREVVGSRADFFNHIAPPQSQLFAEGCR
jgi:competence protein CoiA